MNPGTSISLLSAAVVLSACFFVAGCATTPAEPGSGGTANVNFENPAKFTDVKSRPSESYDEAYLEALGRHIQQQARHYLPSGQTLSINFLDIDMAGDFEPWRMHASDVRFVKSVYPPRLEFTWVVTDLEGNVVSQGRERITDSTFDMAVRQTGDNDPLYYEKEIIDNWLRSKFRGKAKA